MTEFCAECEPRRVIDVVFLLDASGSIGSDVFYDAKLFVAAVVARLNRESRAAVVAFAGHVKVVSELEPVAVSRDVLARRLHGLEYDTGTTRTAKALIAASELFERRPSERERVVVVLTDGESQDNVNDPVASLRLKGTSMYVVAVDTNATMSATDFAQLADDPAHTFLDRSLAPMLPRLSRVLNQRECPPEISFSEDQTAQTDVDELSVSCLEDRLRVNWPLSDPQPLKVFVKGQSKDSRCALDASRIGNFLDIQHGSCDILQQRSLSPRGVSLELTIVLSFHEALITSRDRAVRVRCFYLESVTLPTVVLDVSDPPAAPLSAYNDLPDCLYTVHKDSPLGPLVGLAEVGEVVYHRWECDGNARYGMLVHSCEVRDRDGHSDLLLDEDGCSLDTTIMQTPMYSTDVPLAVLQSQVFTYPDEEHVRFRCKLSLCDKQNADCSKSTPPSCPSESSPRLKRSPELAFDVISNYLVVGDIEDSLRTKTPQSLCVSFTFLISVSSIVGFTVIAVSLLLAFRKQKNQKTITLFLPSLR